MSTGVVAYSDFMIVGIDYGVLCCEACGALVPFDRRDRHDAFHLEVAHRAGCPDHPEGVQG